jgi:hypothetical protein
MKISHSGRISVSLVLTVVAVVCWQPCATFALQQPGSAQVASARPGPNVPDLQIVILEGEDGVNVIKKKTAVKPVVQVRDKNKAPGAAIIAGGVAGAVVLFVLPEKGATGTFPNGARWAQVTADADGRAVAPEIRPVGKGSFKIEIRASYQGQTVTRSITQTNFATVAQAQKAGKTPGSSTHDNLSNESNQQANASQSGASSSSAGSSASAGTAAAAGGHTALIAGVAAAGAAAAGGAAYAVSKNNNSSNSNSNSQSNCDSQVNQTLNDVNNSTSCINANSNNPQACTSTVQTMLNDLGALCSCIGPTNLNASGIGQYVSEIRQELQQVGLVWPSSCQ